MRDSSPDYIAYADAYVSYPMGNREKWTLWRQDDNGSSAVIGAQLAYEEAEAKLRELEARGHKQHYWIERDETSTGPRLNLIVIRSNDMGAAKRFYELIGLQFELHKHGDGAEHFACESEEFVFEIYPETGESTAGVRIGFSVSDVDGLVESLSEAGHMINVMPKDSPWGRRAVVRDPDGHRVELLG